MSCTSCLISVLVMGVAPLQCHRGPFPFCSLLHQCLWPSLEAAVKTMLNLVSEKVGQSPRSNCKYLCDLEQVKFVQFQAPPLVCEHL